MEHEWYSGQLKLTMQKHPREDSNLIIRLYKIEAGVSDSEHENMGTLKMIMLKALKLDYGGNILKDYGTTEREQYFNLVKKNYLGSSIVGRELGVFMESFVEELPYWDKDRRYRD